jgi:hypothetical protein
MLSLAQIWKRDDAGAEVAPGRHLALARDLPVAPALTVLSGWDAMIADYESTPGRPPKLLG